MKSLIFIPDYGEDSLAVAEALEHVRRFAGGSFFVRTVAARPFNTIHTSFLLQQLNWALDKEEAKETIFYLNTDPRTHTKEVAHAAAGSPLVAAFLKNKAVVLSPNAEFCLSLVKGDIEKLYEVRVAADGSQFRSRDVFTIAVGQALKGDITSLLGAELSPDANISALPEGIFVLHSDNYGNIKMFLQKGALDTQGIREGEEVTVSMNGKKISGIRVASTIFTVPVGTVVLAPGSSGPKEDPYFEISLRFNGDASQSAAALFGRPEPGTTVSISR